MDLIFEMLVGQPMRLLEVKLPFPFNHAQNIAANLGGLILHHVHSTGGLNNAMDMNREQIIKDIDQKITDYSVRPLPHLLTSDKEREREAAERNALPELKALREYIDLEAPSSHEERMANEQTPEPNDQARQLLFDLVKKHEFTNRVRRS